MAWAGADDKRWWIPTKERVERGKKDGICHRKGGEDDDGCSDKKKGNDEKERGFFVALPLALLPC